MNPSRDRSALPGPFLLGCAVVLAAALGCDGSIEGPASPPPVSFGPGGQTPSGTLDGRSPEDVLNSPECRSPAPGAAPMRRLSNAEYRNTMNDLLGHIPGVSDRMEDLTSAFPAEPESLGFRNAAHMLTVPQLMAQNYMDAAESLAEFVATDSRLLPCATEDRACALEFVSEFGKRAYRRPLGAEEVDRYAALYDKAIAEGYDFATGVEWIVFTVLQATPFIHRMEFGGAPDGAVTKPSAYETASRLSYLIWQSMPDDALFEAAETGGLDGAEQIEQHARRMLADPKAARLLEYFDQWLDIDSLEGLNRDATNYPDLPDDLPELFRAESRAFVSNLLKSPAGSMRELFTAPYTFVNAELAQHYGLPAPSGSGFQRVDAPGRSGILTQGMMVAHDRPSRTSIVRRGLKVRTDVLCQLVPAPPPDVEFNLEALGEGLSQRERLALHSTEPSCAGCHSLMDPIGVAYEAFDAVGRPRTSDENGLPVVTSAELLRTVDADGPVNNPVELGERLAQSDEVRDCYVTQTFRFFYGRDSQVADQCSMARLVLSFRDSDYSLSELIVALTQTDAFLYRPVVTPEAL